MSILSTSPQDNRLFSAEIAAKLGDLNAAIIVQQLHYWMGKEGVGTVIKGVKFIYKCDSFLRNQGVFNTARWIESISLSNPIWVE